MIRLHPARGPADRDDLAGRDAPLFTDLDGTLIATDLLWESIIAMVKERPWAFLRAAGWALAGRAALEERISREARLDPGLLPYRPEVLDLIRRRREAGGAVYLVTSSPVRWAGAISEHQGIFDGVLYRGGDRDRRGADRLRAIERTCAEKGWSEFDYAGDSAADLLPWGASTVAYVVAAGEGLARRIDRPGPGPKVRTLGAPGRRWRDVAKSLRPHQFAKNLLIFVPLITALRVLDPRALVAALLAFAAFSLCASATYLINDLADLAADRQHAEKRNRPFASGRLPLSWGPPMVVALLLTSFGIAALALPPVFPAILALYIALTIAYSLSLKRRLMVDVLILASLYSLRLFAGGVATGIVVSEWLIVFSMFFFLSLAFAKRYVELDRSIQAGRRERLNGRGYQPDDIEPVKSMGTISGYLSALVLALYVRSDEVRLLYPHHEFLWLIDLGLIYWISRVWFLAVRRQLSGDPVVFALRDPHSLALSLISAVVLVAASWSS